MSKLTALAASLPQNTVSAVSQFSCEVVEALGRVPRSSEARRAIVDYLLAMAAEFSLRNGHDKEWFVDEAGSCYDLAKENLRPREVEKQCLAS